MSILNFDGPSGRNFGKPFKVVLGIGALTAVVAVASTLAANININSGPVEFGQGVAQTTACDDSITVTPRTQFLNSNDSDTVGSQVVTVGAANPDAFIIRAEDRNLFYVGMPIVFEGEDVLTNDPTEVVSIETDTISSSMGYPYFADVTEVYVIVVATDIFDFPTQTTARVGGSGFRFSGVEVRDIDATEGNCRGKTFTLKAYGETETAALATYSVFVGENGFSSGDGSIESFSTGTSSSGFSLTFRSLTISANSVYKITIESSEQINSASVPWSSVTWNESNQSGPSVYANSLTSGKPSWIDEVTTGGDLEYSFSSNGMGIQGNADSLTFPYVSAFTIPHDEKVRVEFIFGYYTRCDDQGMILYSESATPIWNWGMTQNGLIAQWNCGFPEIGWPNGDTYPEDEEMLSLLEIGSAYRGIIDYDPNLSDSNFRLTTKTFNGQIIDSIAINQVLPEGEDYKIGFSSDSDGSDMGQSEGMSYFKNLKITIG